MQNTLIATTKHVVSVKIMQITLALCILVVVPTLTHNQYATGPIVNATLLLAATYIGTSEAMMLGFIPSLVAFLAGLLPLTLAPIIPFIMVSNSLYIYIYSILKKRQLISIALASVSKYLFLSFITFFYFSHVLPAKIVPTVHAMMSYPQLITAVAGGIIAFSAKWLVSDKR